MSTPIDNNKPLISNMVFRYFVRIQYPSVEIDNLSLDLMCIDFIQYLHDMYNSTDSHQLMKIIPIREVELIRSHESPIKIHGFHPALIYHFANFIKKLHTDQTQTTK